MTDFQGGPIPILFQDDWVIAIDKPTGIMVHRSKESTDSVFLHELLVRQLGRSVFPIHRLDRGVSGVLCFATSSEAANRLQQSLRDESTEKQYLALCRGITETGKVLDRPLTSDKGVVQDARTRYERISIREFTFEGQPFFTSLLRVWIETGRRHQIRRHLGHERHQVMGDTMHGKGRVNRLFREHQGLHRIFLHSHRLDMPHPSGVGRLVIESPLPDELAEVLNRSREILEAPDRAFPLP